MSYSFTFKGIQNNMTGKWDACAFRIAGSLLII